jgi:acetyl esterase/lipase
VTEAGILECTLPTLSIFDTSQEALTMARSLWTLHPFKAAYFAVFFITTPPYLLSLSILYSLVKSSRPIAQWTLKQCLARAYLKSWFHALAVTRHQGGTQLVEPKQAKERLVVIEPPSNDHFLGVTTPGTAKPSKVPALWSPTTIESGDLGNQKVVLHFPGGAFVLPLATNEVGESVSKLMTEQFGGASTCFVQYRLSKDSGTRFPAALQDFITAYSYVLKLGVDPKRIILSGDSAGGHLVLAGLRYLEKSQSLLPLPGGLSKYI